MKPGVSHHCCVYTQDHVSDEHAGKHTNTQLQQPGNAQVHPHGGPPALVRGAAGHQLRARLPPAVPPPAGQRNGAAGDHDQVQSVTRVTCHVSRVSTQAVLAAPHPGAGLHQPPGRGLSLP